MLPFGSKLYSRSALLPLGLTRDFTEAELIAACQNSDLSTNFEFQGKLE